MRLWVGYGNAGGQEVGVLRVTQSLVSVSRGCDRSGSPIRLESSTWRWWTRFVNEDSAVLVVKEDNSRSQTAEKRQQRSFVAR